MENKNHTIFNFSGEANDEFLQINYLVYVALLAGGITLFKMLVPGIVILVIATFFLLFFSNTKLKVDTNKKIIANFNLFRTFNVQNYTHIESLYINAKKISQKLNSRGSTTTINFTLYQGVAIADGNKIILTESKEKDKVSEEVTEMARALDLKISDNTQ